MTREEFDVQREVLARTRAKLQELEVKVAELEKEKEAGRRKKEDIAKEERKLIRLFKKVHGCEPTQRSEDGIQRAMANAIPVREAGEPFLLLTS